MSTSFEYISPVNGALFIPLLQSVAYQGTRKGEAKVEAKGEDKGGGQRGG